LAGARRQPRGFASFARFEPHCSRLARSRRVQALIDIYTRSRHTVSWRFRKSFKLLPGVRLNVSRSGISTTIGASPFSVNIGSRGVFSNVSIPGSGISSRQRILGPSAPGQDRLPESVAPGPALPAPRSAARPRADTRSEPAVEIRSASTQQMTSAGLAEFRTLLRQAEDERAQLSRELAAASRRAEDSTSRYRSWADGFLWKRLRPARTHTGCDPDRLAAGVRRKLSSAQRRVLVCSRGRAYLGHSQ
jgi:uncharacterized protein DUF4236